MSNPKKRILMAAGCLAVAAMVAGGVYGFARGGSAHANAATCTLTNFVSPDTGNLLTAAVINPAGTYRGVHGLVDGGGCDIGVYYSAGQTGTIRNTSVFGATEYGILSNGAHISVIKDTVYNIGDHPLDGVQYGVGIAFYNGASGTIDSNLVDQYQKDGIDVLGTSTTATVEHNTVDGLGPVNFIAQNGIEVGEGAGAKVTLNTVNGNSYTGLGDTIATGILIFGGSCFGVAETTNTIVYRNTLSGNDGGIAPVELNVDPNNPNNCVLVTTPSNAKITQNSIANTAVNNTTGAYPNPGGYQAGILDQGDGDQLNGNAICGVGYTPVATPPPYLYYIDDTFTSNVHESKNTFSSSCTASSVSTHVEVSHRASHSPVRPSIGK